MFVPTVGPTDAKIMLVGEAPGETEDRLGQPFKGNAGRILDRILREVGISRFECLIANVARERPPNNKIKYYFEDASCTVPKPKMTEWIQLLKKEIETYQPNVVVALGGTALWALTGKKGIKTFRGTVLEATLVPGQKVIPTYHPQAVGYDYSMLFPTVMDLRKVSFESKSPEIKPDKRNLVVTRRKGELIDYCKEIISHKDDWIVASDIEAISPGPFATWVGFSHDPDFALAFEIVENNKIPTLNENDEIEVWSWIARVYESGVRMVFHNAAYDMGVMWARNGIITKNLYMDTMVAASCLWPESELNLGFLSSICLNVPAWKHTSKGFTKGVYNAADCANTRGLVDVLLTEMKNKDVYSTYERKMSEVEPSLFMQLNGVDVDIDVRDELIQKYQKRLNLIEEGLKSILNKDINFKSPQQLQKLLYVDLELPVQFKRRKSKFDSKKPTTDKEALERLYRKTNDPILKLILEHRGTSKLLDTFLKIELTDQGKVHTSYNIVKAKEVDPVTGRESKQGTVYGRWSSSKSIIYPSGCGNLQNIPRVARRMYVAPPGYEILQADYKQAEAVIVAHLINDVKAIKVFDDPEGDIHKLTASMMFNIPYEEVTKDHRNIGKRLRHAGNYSAGPAVVAHALGVELGEAKKLIQLYHNSCPQLRLWHKSIQAQLTKNKTLVTPLGRKHVFTERWGDQLFRSAYSFIPQSTVGEMLNIALVKFYHKWGDLVSIWMQLHDAMYILKKIKEDRQMWMERMRDCMIIPLEINHREVIIDVDFKVGTNWGPYCDEADPDKNVDLNLGGLKGIKYEGT